MLITRIIKALAAGPERRIDPADRLGPDKQVEILTPDGYWVLWAGKLSRIPEGRHERVHSVRRARHSDRRIEPVLINVVSTPEAVFAAEIDHQEFNAEHGFAQPDGRSLPWQPQSVAIERIPGHAEKKSDLSTSVHDRIHNRKGE